MHSKESRVHAFTPTYLQPLPHYAPLTLPGSYEEAGARLQAALHPCPPSEAARARRGLLQLKKGDMEAAVRDLQCLAETDPGDLGFLLRLLSTEEKQGLAQVWPGTQSLLA